MSYPEDQDLRPKDSDTKSELRMKLWAACNAVDSYKEFYDKWSPLVLVLNTFIDEKIADREPDSRHG